MNIDVMFILFEYIADNKWVKLQFNNWKQGNFVHVITEMCNYNMYCNSISGFRRFLD